MRTEFSYLKAGQCSESTLTGDNIGGFEETMTRREAALILGVRETATREKIKEQHRLLSKQNHPDTGGSPYLAQKINEAKVCSISIFSSVVCREYLKGATAQN